MLTKKEVIANNNKTLQTKQLHAVNKKVARGKQKKLHPAHKRNCTLQTNRVAHWKQQYCRFQAKYDMLQTKNQNDAKKGLKGCVRMSAVSYCRLKYSSSFYPVFLVRNVTFLQPFG